MGMMEQSLLVMEMLWYDCTADAAFEGALFYSWRSGAVTRESLPIDSCVGAATQDSWTACLLLEKFRL